jgi:diaminohydroxyphosphoribosylaminopyrimidine deaminase/5-amino-6-(5-phosphoribosylamino)uracil reductase
MMTKEDLIRKTFELAKRGPGTTWPNPMVGAVIVKDDKIIGMGFHHKAGQDHAEIDALKNCSESVAGATLYVNLEPCCHTHKSTPPCAQRLVAEKFKKVVIANLDPNPSVNGQGVELLRANGIEVEHGVLSHEGEILNEVFFLAQRLKRPFIHYKSAATLDGKTALRSGESQWITGEKARLHVHQLRSLHQGIVVGGETLRRDNPKLTVRLPDYQGPAPKRIVFTKSGKLPQGHSLFTDEFKDTTLIYTFNPLSFSFPTNQVKVISSLKEAMDDLFSKKIINLMLEGGRTLASEFYKEQLIDRISLYQNPSFLGEGAGIFNELGLKSLKERPRLANISSQWLGEDHYITGRLICSQD